MLWAAMKTINDAGTLDREYPVHDSLFFKIQGNDETVKAAAKVIKDIVKRHSSSNFQFATSDAEAEAIWDARKYALMSAIASAEGSRAWTTDVWYAISMYRNSPPLPYKTNWLQCTCIEAASTCPRDETRSQG